jgi:hypothetical protein
LRRVLTFCFFQSVTDVLCNMVEAFTSDTNLCVLATATNVTSINHRLVSSRGQHLLHHTFKIPNIENVSGLRAVCRVLV